MKYTIVIEKPAEKFIVKLPKSEKERVLRAIYQLPNGKDIKELKGNRNSCGCRKSWGYIYKILTSKNELNFIERKTASKHQSALRLFYNNT